METITRIIHALTQVHPLHPMLVHFPIALSGAGAFFILLALLTRKKEFELIAFANISLAAVGTLAAGLTGMRDNFINYDGDAPSASAKFVLAIILLVITTVTAVARWRNPNLFNQPKTKLIYITAYFVSFAIAIVLAFLGAVILYGM